jgi:LEA14-like dessication related protein
MVIACLLFAAAAAPLEITVDPRPGSFVIALTGPVSKATSGPFRGSVSLYGSAAEMPLSGRAEMSQGRLRVTAALAYADVPADWLNRFRRDAFDYRVRVEVSGGEAVSWSGTARWDEVKAGGTGDTLEQFVRLASLELTSLALTRSEGRGFLVVTNPFSFPITLASTSYRLRVDGEEVGAGGTRGRILRAQHRVSLELPFTVQHWRFIGAAGGQWAAGAEIEAELEGSLTLRLPSGDLSIPLRFPARLGTDGARAGVFSHPDGATGLSPR